jgi:hypothetical protein
MAPFLVPLFVEGSVRTVVVNLRMVFRQRVWVQTTYDIDAIASNGLMATAGTAFDVTSSYVNLTGLCSTSTVS